MPMAMPATRGVTVYDDISDWVDNHLDESIVFLREMVRIPTDTPPGDNRRHAERTADLLAKMGFAVERHLVPDAEVKAYGLTSLMNLVVRRPFAEGPVIALNVHGDVVPPGAGWTHPPYEGDVVDGRMYGRGVAVSKSDIATYVYALRALGALDVRLHGSVELHITYDEEYGGLLGPQWLLAKGLSHPDLALGPGFSYAITTAHNGCLQLEVEVHGRSAHAALPDSGVDAIFGAVRVLDAIYAERARYATLHSAVPGIGSPTVNVGTITGGINTNVVPDSVVFRLDRRMIPEEDPVAVEYALRALIEKAAAQTPGISVVIRRLLRAKALTPLPGYQRLVDALQKHGQRFLGETPPTTGSPLYTDARLYAEAGVPTVLYGAGPRTVLEANAKRADENLVIEDLRKATKVVACALFDLLHNYTPSSNAH
jgi:acetylornithine deacetylase/succinyl-diaminopimelate desuccinylase family protein